MRDATPLALYPRLLGTSWHELAPPVRRLHLGGASAPMVGSFRIKHGTSRFGRYLARLLFMPLATEAADIRLIVTPVGQGEHWVRSFDERTLVSTQWETCDGRLIERLKVLELRFRLEVRDGALIYRQVGAALCLGPLRVPLPRRLAPRIEAREEPVGADRVRVSVAVTLPWKGLLISYEGCAKRQEASS